MSRELLQQALAYIKDIRDHCACEGIDCEEETNLVVALEAELAKPEQESIQAIADVIDYLYGTGADNDMANRAHFALKQLQMNLRDQTALHLLYKGDYEDLLAKPEQEPVAWRNAAIRVGEDLCSVGPFNYYGMSAEEWLNWALSVVTCHAPPRTSIEHAVIAGVLYDFMGWLTSRRARLCLSDSDNASPAVDAIVDFAKMRGLKLEDAQVEHWQTIIMTTPRKEWVGLTQVEINYSISNLLKNDTDPLMTLAYVIEKKLKEKNGIA